MSRKLQVVAVSGSLQRPSRTLVLLEAILAELARSTTVDIRLIELGDIAPHLAGAVARGQLSPAAAEAVAAIETADVLVVASPVYRASYTGLFKHLFDFVHHEALINKPVLLAATGGSERHALVIDHQLRPLFSFFQARTLPIGVYAAEKEFDGYAIGASPLQARIELAIRRALPLLSTQAGTEVAAVEALAA
jgi:FMN reductase